MVSQIILRDGFGVVSPTKLRELLLFKNDQSGSNGDESTGTTEDGDAVFFSDCLPSKAAEAWPLPKAFYSFYFVKQHPFDDYEIRTRIDEADKEIYVCNVARIHYSSILKAKRAERSALFTQMERLKSERDGYNVIFDENKPRSFIGGQQCSGEKDDYLIYNMHYRIEHESITLSEEKQPFKEIKHPEGTQVKIIANSATKLRIQDSLRQKETLVDHRIKSMALNMNGANKERLTITAKINRLSEKLRRIKIEMESLDAKLAGILDKRDKAFERIKMLRRQRDVRNATYFQSLTVVKRAKTLAATGNVRDVQDLANAEIEIFMSLWNTDKAFRDDYVERVSASLDERQLSQDGRIKNPEQDPPDSLEALGPLDFSTEGVVRARDKWRREDLISCSSEVGKVDLEETKKAEGEMVTDSNESSSEERGCMSSEILKYQELQMEEEIDEETLKEKKRVEQLEKARQAMERKRKLLEKAAAKAAIRAQKEAEKRLREREKKIKKKAAVVTCSLQDPDETPEAFTSTHGQEKLEVSALVKEKRSVTPRQISFRYRHRRNATQALPKAIIKRRKADRFWVCAASLTAFALALLILALFYVR